MQWNTIWVCSQLSCRPRFSSIQEAFLQSSQVEKGYGPAVLWDALGTQSWAIFPPGSTRYGVYAEFRITPRYWDKVSGAMIWPQNGHCQYSSMVALSGHNCLRYRDLIRPKRHQVHPLDSGQCLVGMGRNWDPKTLDHGMAASAVWRMHKICTCFPSGEESRWADKK